MSLFAKALKYGLLNKVINEARKPQNQQKAKEAFQSLMEKRRAGKMPQAR